jgi:hypothetical protein
MRLSTVSLLCVLLFSSVAFAQHHETGSAPSAPAASPAPSPAPSFSPPPASSAPSISHSAPSAPVSTPVMHSAPSPSPSPSPMQSVMSSSSISSNSTHNAPESGPQSGTAGNISAKSPAISKIADDRAVETPALKKPAESDLRHPVCAGGKCPELAPVFQKTPPPQNDALRHCLTAECKCPPGQSQGKGGCVANPTNPTVTKNETCSAGTAWNGSSCVSTNEVCPAGQTWDGALCTIASCPAGKILRGGACMEDCTLTNAQAYAKVPDVQNARRDRDDACRQGLGTTHCQLADGHYQNILAEYRMLWASAPAECRAPLPVPDTL